MRSTIGRPRRVTDEQVTKILAWHETIQALEVRRKSVQTLRQLCEELGLSKSTVYHVIRSRGQLKQASPEHRERELRKRRRRMNALRRMARGRRG